MLLVHKLPIDKIKAAEQIGVEKANVAWDLDEENHRDKLKNFIYCADHVLHNFDPFRFQQECNGQEPQLTELLMLEGYKAVACLRSFEENYNEVRDTPTCHGAIAAVELLHAFKVFSGNGRPLVYCKPNQYFFDKTPDLVAA